MKYHQHNADKAGNSCQKQTEWFGQACKAKSHHSNNIYAYGMDDSESIESESPLFQPNFTFF
jgi:hypothetical protein